VRNPGGYDVVLNQQNTIRILAEWLCQHLPAKSVFHIPGFNPYNRFQLQILERKIWKDIGIVDYDPRRWPQEIIHVLNTVNAPHPQGPLQLPPGLSYDALIKGLRMWIREVEKTLKTQLKHAAHVQSAKKRRDLKRFYRKEKL
jgi:hypothetical protein